MAAFLLVAGRAEYYNNLTEYKGGKMVGFVMLFAGLCGTCAAAEPRVSTVAVCAVTEMRTAEEMLESVSLRLGLFAPRLAGPAAGAEITAEKPRAADTAALELAQLEQTARQVFALLTELTGADCSACSGLAVRAAALGASAKTAAARARGLARGLGDNRCPPQVAARAGGVASALDLVSAAGETLAGHCRPEQAAKPAGALRPDK